MDLTRESSQAPDVTSRMERAGVGYLRVAAIGAKTADLAKSQAAELVKNGASTLLVDVRRTSGGTSDNGLALARVFVGQGTLAMRESRGTARESIAARTADGAISQPVIILMDNGTSGAAELFAAALVREQARGADWRTDHRPRRAAAADQAAGRHRPVAHDDPLPHARRLRTPRKRPRTRRPRGRT